jgi:hypothetical protein
MLVAETIRQLWKAALRMPLYLGRQNTCRIRYESRGIVAGIISLRTESQLWKGALRKLPYKTPTKVAL